MKLKRWRERMRGSYTIVDLSEKILLFLEAPHPQTFVVMYPILSHDKKEIHYRITEKTSKGSLRTSHTVLREGPATVFCTATGKYVEELATRCFTTSPGASTAKFMAANQLTALKDEAPWTLDEWAEEDRTAQAFIRNFKLYMREIAGICVPFSKNLASLYPAEIRRDMRDFPHFTSVIKVLAALHFMQRPVIERNGKRYLVATLTDVENARRIFFSIFETTRSGLSKNLLDFYYDIIMTRDQWAASELTKKYNKAFPLKRSNRTVKRYLSDLSDAGYVNIEPNPDNKRINIYKPIITYRTVSDIFKMSIITSSFFENNFKTWLNQYGQTIRFYIYNSKTLSEATPDQFEREIFSIRDLLSCPSWEKHVSGLKNENKAELLDNHEMSNSVQYKSVNISEAIKQLQSSLLPKRFIESDFVEHAVKLGLTEEQSTDLFRSFTGNRILRDPEGYWQWV